MHHNKEDVSFMELALCLTDDSVSPAPEGATYYE
jgi:hypothetical protein